MIRLREQFAEHDARAKEKIREVFEFANTKAPHIVYNVNYWLFGEVEDRMPPCYCGKDPEVMLKYQLDKIKEHYQHYDNDAYIGFLMPWFGTGVLSSSFGVPVNYPEKADPMVGLFIIDNPEEIEGLEHEDFYQNRETARVLNTIDYFKEQTDLPVGVTDCQGPLTTALQIVGYENFIYWMYDHPEEVHLLMSKVTDALIEWVKLQKEHAGQPLEGEAYILGVRIPEGYGGVWISDDDSVIFDTASYREFVVPYNSRVLQACGGGGIHYCGDATQHIDNYLSTEGLTCLHNLHLDNIPGAVKMKEALSTEQIPYLACDFSPSNGRLKSYFKDLVTTLDQTGTIVTSYISPAIELDNGMYKANRRDELQLGLRTKELLARAIG